MSMSRKILVLLFLAAQLLAPGLAYAQGRGGPGGGGSGPGGGMGPGRFDGPGSMGPESRYSGPRGLSDQDTARRAVERREALPLERIIASLRLHSAGQIVNAALVRYKGVLYYRLTVLEPSGEVREMDFVAGTGEAVELK